MNYHVITPAEEALVMETEDGRVVEVWPTPPSSLPPAAAPPSPVPDR